MMKNTKNVYVSLQLKKDDTSGELLLNIQFNQEAPNFYSEKGTISWSPTNEELDFVSEAFEMIAIGKRHRQEGILESPDKEHYGTHELARETDENGILDRVLEKKRPY